MFLNQHNVKKFERILSKKSDIFINTNSHLNINLNSDDNKINANNDNNETNLIRSIANNLKDQIEHANEIPTFSSRLSIKNVSTTLAHETSAFQSTLKSTKTTTTMPRNTLSNADVFQSHSSLNHGRSSNVQNPSNINVNNYRRYDNSRSNKRMRIHEEFMRKENELFQKHQVTSVTD